MKGSSDKFHFIASNNDTHQILVHNFPIGSRSWEKLLGIKIYLRLTFYDDVQDMQGCENTKSIIQRNTIHENGKKNISVTYFFSSQSNCYPLIWILRSCQNNNIVKHRQDS